MKNIAIKEITHQHAQKYLQAKADESLQPREQAALETHLANCPTCQAYAAELGTTEKRMRQFFQNQWHRQSLTDPLPVIQTQMRRTMMQKQTFRLAYTALVAALLIITLVGILTFFPSEPQINPAVQPTLTTQLTTETIPTVKPLPTETNLSPTASLQPTSPDNLYPLGLVPAQSDSLLVPPPKSSTADCETDSSSYSCQVEKAEAKAGFDAKEFPYDPMDTHFDQIISTANPREITFIFRGDPFDRIFLKQGIGDYPPSEREGIPQETFEDVMVGELPAQYVQGAVLYQGDGKTSTWNPAVPTMTVFWQDEEQWFILSATVSSTFHPLLDNREAFIGMASSLVNQRDADHLNSVWEAKRISELDLVEPTLLPEGFYFSYAEFDATNNIVRLIYAMPGNAALILTEQLTGSRPIEELTSSAQETTWMPGSQLLHSLSWETDSLSISMRFFVVDGFLGWLGDERMQRIANSVSILPSPTTPIRQYISQADDSIWSIAQTFGLQPETILWANEELFDNPHFLIAGMTLNIPSVDGVYFTIQGAITLETIASEFDANIEDIISFPGNFSDPSNPILIPGHMLMIPNGHRPLDPWIMPTTTRDNDTDLTSYGPGACNQSYDGAIGSGIFIWPTDDHYISGNDYWSAHPGIDIAVTLSDTPIYAVDAGVIVFSGWSNFGYGNILIIDHGNGYQTIYSHLDKVTAYCGESVVAGQIVGYPGVTGNTDGRPHLHFEIHLNGEPINPWTVLPEP